MWVFCKRRVGVTCTSEKRGMPVSVIFTLSYDVSVSTLTYKDQEKAVLIECEQIDLISSERHASMCF